MRAAVRAPSLMALAASLGCSAAPSPRRDLLPPSATSVATPAPILPPARWVRASGATSVGPNFPEGTLVLLGGRRALVRKDGSVQTELAPRIEPLEELVEVPIPGGRRVLGRGRHDIYRLDEPLGPAVLLARSVAPLAGIGAGPSVLAVWDSQSDAPRFLDVETGRPTSVPSLPELPMRALAFRSITDGAAVFFGAGLATTTDGGSSWRVVEAANPGDGVRVQGLRARGGALSAFLYAQGREAAVDPSKARLGAFGEPAPDRGDAPLLRWVRVTGRDPLEAAVEEGVASSAGGSIVASHGLLGRVDLDTGALLELSEFARGTGLGPCSVARGGASAWIGCALAEQSDDSLYDPFGVLELPLAQSPAPNSSPSARTVLRRNGQAELRASPSGGVLLTGPCDAEGDGSVCARQPDGSWLSLTSELDLSARGTGPLQSGEVAFVRGLFDGDELPKSGPAPHERIPEGSRPAQIFVLDQTGRERAFGSAFHVRGEVQIASPIEEDEQRGLHLGAVDDAGAFAVVQSPNGDPVLVRIAGGRDVRLRGNRGLSLGAGGVHASEDGGLTWSEVPAPVDMSAIGGEHGASSDELRSPSALDEGSSFAVSEVGARIDGLLRVGWGAGQATAVAPAPASAVVLEARAPTPKAPPRALFCTPEGPAGPDASGRTRVSARGVEARELLATKSPPLAGARREVSVARLNPTTLGTLALLEEQGEARAGGRPKTWTLRWFDEAELGARVRSWTQAPPKNVSWGAKLAVAAAFKDRALLTVRTSAGHVLVRLGPGTRAEMLPVPFDLLPTEEITFSVEPDGPIAWLHADASVSTLVIWSSGSPPRAVLQLSSRSNPTLGAPTKDRIALFIASSDGWFSRVVPLPADKRDRREKIGVSTTAMPITGWARTADLRRTATTLPACGAEPKGVRVLVRRERLAIRIGPGESKEWNALLAIRVAAAACVEFVAATSSEGAGASGGSVVRADPIRKLGEAAPRGAAGPAATQRLSCSLDAAGR